MPPSSQIHAISIYENLRCILKHFAKSPKSIKLLNNALKILDINKIHLLNWGSTRMAGFLNACVWVSKIILPFLDTIVTYSIRPEEAIVAASLKGIGSYTCRPYFSKTCKSTVVKKSYIWKNMLPKIIIEHPFC